MRGLTLALTLALTLPLTLPLTSTLTLTLALTSALTRCEVALGSCVWPPTEPIFDARVRWLSECDGEGGGEDDSGGEGEGAGEGGSEGEGGCSVVALEGAAALGPLVTEWQAVCMHMHMQYAVLLCACLQCTCTCSMQRCWPSLAACTPPSLVFQTTYLLTH